LSRVYTDFLLALDEDGEPADPALFPRMWERLRRDLRWQLRRRGLWESSPSHLGVYGWGRWYGPEPVAELGPGDRLSRTRDALDDLAAAAYLYVFADRQRSLRGQLKVKKSVGGVVRRALGCFVHDTQKRHDPFGYRVYVVLASAVEKAVNEGGLHRLDDGRKVGNDAVFGFRPDVDPTAASTDLGSIVGPWNDRLLPGLITARGEEKRELVALLSELVVGLREEGVEAFRFKELIDPLKIDARARWAALWDDRETGFEEAPEEGDFAEVVRILHPDTEVEEQDRFEKLSACVDRGLRRRRARKRTRRHLLELWRFLRAFAAGGAPSGSGESLPSQRRLSELLRIPRDRFPELFAVLREEIERCFPSISGVGAVSISGGGSSSPNGTERALAKDADLQAQLLRRTAEALRRNREEESAPGPPAPGDLYLLPSGEGEGIEWLLVEEVGRGFVALAADPFLLLGSGDVEVAAGVPAGPLAVRCDDAVRVGAALLATGERSARLDPGELARVLEHRRQLAAGTLDPDDDALEMDDDPEYREWREELRAARTAVASAELDADGAEEGGDDGADEGSGCRGAQVARFPSPEETKDDGDGDDGAYARSFGNPLTLAATVLVAVGVGAVGGLVFEQERRGDRLAELERSRDQLALEVGELEDRLATSDDERRRLAEEQRAAEERYRKELEEALSSDPVVAPPWAILTPGNTRGDGEIVEVPAEAKRILLTLYLPPVDPGDRLEVRRRATGEVVWSTELRGESPDPETHLILPRQLLPAGDYRLVHLRGGRELESFGLRVIDAG